MRNQYCISEHLCAAELGAIQNLRRALQVALLQPNLFMSHNHIFLRADLKVGVPPILAPLLQLQWSLVHALSKAAQSLPD